MRLHRQGPCGASPASTGLLGGNDPHVHHAVADAHAGICMVASAACSSMPGLPGTGLHRQGPCGASPASTGSARRPRPARQPRRRRRSCGHLHGCVGCLLVDAGLARHRASLARPMRGEPRIYGSARRQRPARQPRRRRRSCGHLHGCVGCLLVGAGLARHRASSARLLRGEPRIYGVCSVATTRTSTTPSPTRARSASPSRTCAVERTSAPSSARVRIA